MLNDLIKKIDYFWLFLIITVILCFGFTLTNPSMGVDDEIIPLFHSFYSKLSSNRLGTFFTINLLDTCEFLPFWRDFLALCFYVLGIVLHCENFYKYMNSEIFDKKAATIFACLLVSFPFFAYNFIFMCTSLEHGLIMFFSAIAVDKFYRYFYKNATPNKIDLFYCLFLLLFVISLYEIGIIYFFLSTSFILINNLINKDNYNYKKELAYSLLIPCFSFSINLILLKIFECIFSREEYTIFRFDSFFSYDTSSLINFLLSFKISLFGFISNFIETTKYNFGSKMVVFCSFVFMVLILYFAIKRKKPLILFIGLFMFVIPFISFIITGFVDLTYRAYSAVGFFNALIFAFLYLLIKKNNKLVSILIAIVAFCVLQQSKEINQIFYTEYLKSQADRVYANLLMYDLQRKNLQKKPLIIVGTRENSELKHSYYIDCPEANVSIINWDRYDSALNELYVLRFFFFLKEMGYDVKSFLHLEENKTIEAQKYYYELIKDNISDMGNYPQENSIKDMDDFVIIKIGKSQLEQ